MSKLGWAKRIKIEWAKNSLILEQDIDIVKIVLKSIQHAIQITRYKCDDSRVESTPHRALVGSLTDRWSVYTSLDSGTNTSVRATGKVHAIKY